MQSGERRTGIRREVTFHILRGHAALDGDAAHTDTILMREVIRGHQGSSDALIRS